MGDVGLSKNTRKNVIGAALVIFLVIGSLVGCADRAEVPLGQEQAMQLYQYIQAGDAQGIQRMFSPLAATSFNLSTQIEQFLAFPEGNVTGYSELEGDKDAAKYRNGTIAELWQYGSFKMKTDADKTYQVILRSVSVCKETDQKIGMFYISIVDLDGYDPQSGTYPPSCRMEIGCAKGIE